MFFLFSVANELVQGSPFSMSANLIGQVIKKSKIKA